MEESAKKNLMDINEDEYYSDNYSISSEINYMKSMNAEKQDYTTNTSFLKSVNYSKT